MNIMKLNKRQSKLLNILSTQKWLSRSQMINFLKTEHEEVSFMTVNRDLSYLLNLNLIEKHGNGKATSYRLSIKYNLLRNIDTKEYYEKDIDHREIIERFNSNIFSLIQNEVLTKEELSELNTLNEIFNGNLKQLSDVIRKKEFERVIIEISWKSSVLEGNTYTLLETETLLKDGIEAKGKKKEEAIMIINHKEALEFILQNGDQFIELNVRIIEHIHSMLIDNLGVTKNIRNSLVRITGTNYKPLDNKFQIREALEQYCEIINNKANVFEKALLTIPLIGYIQPFEDGNKRTGRIIANALLLSNNSFPLSFRNVDVNEYREAMVVFYEINNLSLLKNIFMQQSRFVVENYFNPTA